MGEERYSQVEMRELAKQVAKETIREFYIKVGIDPNDPISMQKDLAFLRAQRQGYENIGIKVKMTIIGILIAASLSALWYGIKHAIMNN